MEIASQYGWPTPKACLGDMDSRINLLQVSAIGRWLFMAVFLMPLMARATSNDTPESIAISSVAAFSQLYMAEHGGRVPASWQDLQEFGEIGAVSRVNRRFSVNGDRYFQERYQFFPQGQLPMDGGSIVFMRLVPLARDGWPWEKPVLRRYVILLRGDQLIATALKESVVQNVLSRANASLQGADELPSLEYETARSSYDDLTWILLALLGAIGLWAFFWRASIDGEAYS